MCSNKEVKDEGMRNIVIVAPSGSGKSTICKIQDTQLVDSDGLPKIRQIYAGLNTTFGLKWWLGDKRADAQSIKKSAFREIACGDDFSFEVPILTAEPDLVDLNRDICITVIPSPEVLFSNLLRRDSSHKPQLEQSYKTHVWPYIEWACDQGVYITGSLTQALAFLYVTTYPRFILESEMQHSDRARIDNIIDDLVSLAHYGATTQVGGLHYRCPGAEQFFLGLYERDI
jgi:hypothetical protein